jgi:hypothetical protein
MPLQKMPQGPPSSESQMTKRRQLQERRRTLQTISELSAADGHTADFRLSGGARQRISGSHQGPPLSVRKTPNTSKRRSLPQYCARPECIENRILPAVSTIHIMTPQRLPLDHEGHASLASQPTAGWNARRERARMQAEQALSGAELRQKSSVSSLQSTNYADRPTASPQPRNKPSQPYLKAYYSQQHLLHNGRSMSSTSSRSDLQSSQGRSPKHPNIHDPEADSSELTSTDSSSYRSSRDSTMRRSRSSSSSQSSIIQGVPPLPTGCAQPTRSYYTAVTSHYHKGYPYQLPGPMYAQAPSETRTLSLPYMYNDRANTPLLGYMPSPSPVPPNTLLSNHYNSVEKQRSKSLSSKSAPSYQHIREGRTTRPPAPTQPPRQPADKPTIPSLRASSATKSTSSPPNRHRTSSLKSPSSSYLPKRTETVKFDQASTQRATPDRESLTKWKSEREEAKAEFDFTQRAKMKERVRRANEMEQEKEKELQALGLGAEKGARVLGIGLKSEERGCFGGVFGRIWGRKGKW